jgi:hypothetical protein
MFIDEPADSRREHRVIPYRVADGVLPVPCAPGSLLRLPPVRSDAWNRRKPANA